MHFFDDSVLQVVLQSKIRTNNWQVKLPCVCKKSTGKVMRQTSVAIAAEAENYEAKLPVTECEKAS